MGAGVDHRFSGWSDRTPKRDSHRTQRNKFKPRDATTNPSLITAAFAQYVIDSYWVHRRAKLRGSKLGRYNGILYFVPSIIDIFIRMGLGFLQPLLSILVWLLVLTTLVSMGQRLMFRRTTQTVPGSPAAETAGPSQR